MKVTKAEVPMKVEGRDTVVGEVYTFDGTGEVYYRHESGLANLQTGENQALETTVGGARFTHHPNVELVLK